jgi:hypothetical protein
VFTQAGSEVEGTLTRFLVPVEGLAVTRTWSVGPVTFHPFAELEWLLADTTDADDRARTLLGSTPGAAIADLTTGALIDDMVDTVQASIDALRLFQLGRALVWPTWFGLPGDIYRSLLRFVVIRGGQAGIGGRFRGQQPGYTLTDEAYQDWQESKAFSFLSDALIDPTATEGVRRAVVGTRLFSRAAAERRPEMQVLLASAALEAWLGLRDRAQTQTLLLARHEAWFGCGLEQGSLCGRDRPACAYLQLNPHDRHDRARMTALRKLGATDPSYQCSEWLDFMEWYDLRSAAAHGEPLTADDNVASKALFRISHHLCEPILQWLSAYQDDPVGELEKAIAALLPPPRWDATVSLLDQLRSSDQH